ncbi:carbohydrate-binding protein [Chitinophaga barathri]
MPTIPSTQSIKFRVPCNGVLPWSSGTVYNAGQFVVHNGRLYVAKWWTQGEMPGISLVWEDQGACS